MLNRPRATLWNNPKWDDLTGNDSRSVRPGAPNNGDGPAPGQGATTGSRGYQDRYSNREPENRFRFTLARHCEKSARVNKSSPFYNAQSQLPQSASQQAGGRRGYGSGLGGGNSCSTGNIAVYSANSVPEAAHSSIFAASPSGRQGGKGKGKGRKAKQPQEKFTFTSLFPRDERGGRKSGLKCNIFHQYQKECLCKACQGVRDNVSLPPRYGTEESFVESKHALTTCHQGEPEGENGTESKGRNKLRMAIAMTRECGFAQMPSKTESGTQQQHFRIFSDAIPDPPPAAPGRAEPPQPAAAQPTREEGANQEVGVEDLLDFDLSIRDSPKQGPPSPPPAPPATAPQPPPDQPGPPQHPPKSQGVAGLPSGASDTRIRPTDPYKGPKVPNSHLWQPSGRVGSLGPSGPSTKPPRPVARDPQSSIVRSGYYVKRR